MSDEFDQYIDWSKGDLLDACYDSAIVAWARQGVRFSQVPNPFRGADSFSISWNRVGTFTKPEPHLDFENEQLSASSVVNEKIGMQDLEDSQRPQPTMTRPAFVESFYRAISPCQECGASIPGTTLMNSNYLKDIHARQFNHAAYSCGVTGCVRKFMIEAERHAHERRPHISGHGRVLTSTPNDCIECHEILRSKSDLLRHAKLRQHQPYGCECGAFFSRLDVLNGHLESFSTEDPKHPCKYCKLHRGPNGFRRLDHLMQHIRNYHHVEIDDETAVTESRLKYSFPVCPHPECPQYRDEEFKKLPRKKQADNKPFNSQSSYTKHMRDEHNECPFPCDVRGCGRVGRRGYFREKDLLKHRRQEHPDASRYEVAKRELRILCTEPGCSALMDPSSMLDHTHAHSWKAYQEAKGQPLKPL